ncbi:MAG TPA: hypothetical protein VGD66_13590 [Allosphingosinicella sp.]|jgi:hypothetical protein
MPERQMPTVRDDRGGAPCLSPPAAVYVNYFEVGHNPFEFLMDLGQYHPGNGDDAGRFSIHTSVAIAPPYAKMFSDLLARAIAEHESEHGSIPVIGAGSTPFDIVLSSLGEFEDRARALRAGRRPDPAGDPGLNGHSARAPAAAPHPRKDR